MSLKTHKNILKKSEFETPLGPMIAIADENVLYLLEFFDRKNVKQEIERLKTKMQATIIPGQTQQLDSIQKELKQYFAGTLKEFKTPLHLLGTSFQKTVWQALKNIPFGQTQSYAQLASAIKRNKAFRAVARANSTNQLAIIIPCHRVINSSGSLGGYAAGLMRKQWLIDHEECLFK